MMLTIVLLIICIYTTNGFRSFPTRHLAKSSLSMADVEITFPNNKKVKAASGSSLKEAAKKAGFTPNYGCEEGKLLFTFPILTLSTYAKNIFLEL